MIDSSDELRFAIAVNEFQELQHVPGFDHSVPILFLVNKCDHHEAKPPAYFHEMFNLKSLKNPYNLFQSSAKTGVGLEQGIQWLST